MVSIERSREKWERNRKAAIAASWSTQSGGLWKGSRPFWWSVFGLSLAALSLALWTSVVAPAPRGEWREQIVGQRVGIPPLESMSGEEVHIVHPAIIYFFGEQCRFCEMVVPHLNMFALGAGAGKLPIYAVTNGPSVRTSARDPQLAPSIRVARVTRPTPSLHFVTEVPLFVRTNGSGLVERAFVGVAEQDEFMALLQPRETGASEKH